MITQAKPGWLGQERQQKTNWKAAPAVVILTRADRGQDLSSSGKK